jgi:hypothetical protein
VSGTPRRTLAGRAKQDLAGLYRGNARDRINPASRLASLNLTFEKSTPGWDIWDAADLPHCRLAVHSAGGVLAWPNSVLCPAIACTSRLTPAEGELASRSYRRWARPPGARTSGPCKRAFSGERRQPQVVPEGRIPGARKARAAATDGRPLARRGSDGAQKTNRGRVGAFFISGASPQPLRH